MNTIIPITYFIYKVLRIDPVQGELRPGECVLTKIVFCAAGEPSFYDLDLICEVGTLALQDI